MSDPSACFERSELDALLAEFDLHRPEDPAAADAYRHTLQTCLDNRGDLLPMDTEGRPVNPEWIQADLWYLEGMLCHVRGDLSAAARLLQRSVDLSKSSGHRRRQIMALRSLAKSFENAGMQEESTRCVSDAFDLADQLGDLRISALVSHTVTWLYQAQQAFEPLLASALRTCELAQGTNDPHLLSRAYSSVGVALGHLGRAAEGLTWLDRATKLVKDAEQPMEALFLDLNRCFLLKNVGDIEAASSLAEKHASAVDRIPADDAARLAVLIAELRLLTGDPDGARAMLERADDAAQSKQMTAHLVHYYQVAAEIAEVSGDDRLALAMLRRHVVVGRDLSGRKAQVRLLALERRFAAELAAKSDEIRQLKVIDQQRAMDLIGKNSQLSDLVRERDEILNVLSHDLRSPLAAATMLGDSLIHDVNDVLHPDVVERVEAIRSATSEMGETIDNLLASHNTTVASNPSPTSTAVRQAITDLRPRASANGVMIEDAVVEVDLNVDSPLLRRALDDLMWNAIESAGEGATIQVRVEPTEVGASITMEGDGIDFEPRTRRGRSLYIARRLVERMPGSLTLAGIDGTATATIDLR